MSFYLAPAVVVAGIAFHALAQDRDASITDVRNWLFIGLAAAIWPVTLPPMLWKKYQQFSVLALRSSRNRQRTFREESYGSYNSAALTKQ
jgi:hypothetical protein